MLKEKVLIIFLAILGGVIFSIGLFYLYQKTRISPQPPQKEVSQPAQPSPAPFFLNIDNPQDEEVVDKKIIPLEGKTGPGATVIVSLEDKELVFTSSSDGSFSANITLLEGVNFIEITAINLDGKSLSEKRTLTFTTESF